MLTNDGWRNHDQESGIRNQEDVWTRYSNKQTNNDTLNRGHFHGLNCINVLKQCLHDRCVYNITRHNVHLLAQSLGLGRLSAPVLLPWARAAAHSKEATRRLSRTILKLGTLCIV